MSYQPLVSIIIPVYNGSNFMKIAIDSALAQSYEGVEVIVVNDGSNDEGKTDEIARSYGDKIRYFSKENGGVASALNIGLKNMKGEWFSWLSHDDVYKPDKIKHQIDLLNKYIEQDESFKKEKCVVYCGSESINAQGKVILRRKYKPVERRNIDSILLNLPFMHVGGCTMLINREAFNDIGMFDSKKINVQDKDLIYKLYYNKYTFLFVDEYLVQSRRHKEQTGNKVKSTWQQEIDDLNCEFINEIVSRNICSDDKTFRAMLIHYLRNRSKPTVNLIKGILKERCSFLKYVFYIEIPVLYWQVYGLLRRCLRFFYRKLIAGQN